MGMSMHLSVWIFLIIHLLRQGMFVKPPPREYLDEFLDLVNSSLNKLLDDDTLQSIISSDESSLVSKRELEKSSYASKMPVESEKRSDVLSGKDPILISKNRGQDAIIEGQPSLVNSPSNSVRRQLDLEADQKDNPLMFDGNEEQKFVPSIACDRFDVGRHHCILVRQLGTTLTLGVKVAGPVRAGTKIRWYRYLKKQQSEHYIRENLKRDFLPWNLNLGGSRRELRISPITETDRSYNYYVAELEAFLQPGYRQSTFAKRPVIRFTIEPVHLGMGRLYHGEEIVLNARSYMTVPQRSVQFFWSLFDSSDLVDHGLPSNMHLNADKSAVVIKELKTYQNQVLTCTAYSNKNVFLARRDFLFRGSANEEFGSSKHPQSPLSRSKRNIDLRDQQPPEKIAEDYDREAYYTKNPFYSVQSRDFWSPLKVHPLILDEKYKRTYRSGEIDSNHNSEPPPKDGNIKEEENMQLDPLKFDDVESQIMASCATSHDCNVNAVCTRASFSGQKFCKCLHGYNGNGIFCMIELQ